MCVKTGQVSCRGLNPRSVRDSESLQSKKKGENKGTEGGGRRRSRNNSKQTLGEKQLFHFGGGKEARCEAQMTANTEGE